MHQGTFFISGIDTGIGKTYATGYLARQWQQDHPDKRVITQKIIQTGNQGISEDIEQHRKIMQIDLLPEDHQGLTMPEIFSYPASPHLASELDQRPIDFDKINAATQSLQDSFDYVLIEGAGGLMVPLTRDLLTVDFLHEKQWPVILVTCGRLGSINHTLLSLKLLQQYDLDLFAVVYNHYFDQEETLIAKDNQQFLKTYVQANFPDAHYWDIPTL